MTFSLLLNGNVTSSFKPSLGIRQGDHLSPLLFIIGFEVLTRLISVKESKGTMHVIKVSRSVPAISHLMYADDLLVLTRMDRQNTLSFKTYFDKSCKWSGQETNLEKSSILFLKDTFRGDKWEVKEVTSFKMTKTSSVYLGNSLVMGHNCVK